MPKFKNGECALLMSCKNPLYPYYEKFFGTVVRIVEFIGIAGGSGCSDWYTVELENDEGARAREIVLQKLPDEYSPGDMRVIEELMNKKESVVHE